jgi:cytochrome c5
MYLNRGLMKKNSSLIVVMVLLFLGSYEIVAQENNNWIAPTFSNNVKNPFVGNARATAEGKEIYNQMCVLCHGLQGKGNSKLY